MKPGQHAGLGLGIQVHQGVPAGEQIDPRDRRVIDQVVAPEDDLAAEVLAKEIEAVDMLEVFRQQLRRNSLHLPFLVRGLASSIERVFVHIGRVDLDLLPEPIGPEPSARIMAIV